MTQEQLTKSQKKHLKNIETWIWVAIHIAPFIFILGLISKIFNFIIPSKEVKQQ